jgi:hypothetical protein
MNEYLPSNDRNPGDERLDALFRAYHMACEPRQISPNFMPELWQKIEKAQSAVFSFRRIAKGFVTAAAALSMALAAVLFLPAGQQNPAAYGASYIDALAAHNEALAAHSTSDNVEYVMDLMHPDSLDESAEEI